jgi:cytoskeleton protein RodZ
MSDKAFDARSPGDMLRAAREKQGLHIAALAAAIKVAPRKLDALEHDRWDELPDATFVRALAQTVCRTLKIDSAPIMELLPRAGAIPLAPDSGGLNTPFRERPGRDEPALSLGAVRPMVIAAALLMLAALAVYFVPEKFWASKLAFPGASQAPAAAVGVSQASNAALAASAASAASSPEASPAADQAQSAASAPAALPASVVPVEMPSAQTGASPPTLVAASAAAGASAAGGVSVAGAANASGAVQLRANGASWMEVRDAGGKVLLSRLVASGEKLGLDGKLPMRLTIGNASAVELDFRGAAFDLKPLTRDNVARVELK